MLSCGGCGENRDEDAAKIVRRRGSCDMVHCTYRVKFYSTTGTCAHVQPRCRDDGTTGYLVELVNRKQLRKYFGVLRSKSIDFSKLKFSSYFEEAR
jgi:hypothetical protein